MPPGVISMTIRSIAAAAGAAAVLSAGLGPITAASAATSRIPVIYGTYGNWQTPRVKPRVQVMGACFVLRDMRWKAWNGRYAKAGGIDQVAPRGCASRAYDWRSTITLYRVRIHKGRRYYSRMTITSHGHPTIRRIYRIPGGWFPP